MSCLAIYYYTDSIHNLLKGSIHRKDYARGYAYAYIDTSHMFDIRIRVLFAFDISYPPLVSMIAVNEK